MNFVSLQWWEKLSQVSDHCTTSGWTERKRQTGNLDHESTGNPVYVAYDSQNVVEEGKGRVAGHQLTDLQGKEWNIAFLPLWAAAQTKLLYAAYNEQWLDCESVH